MRSRYGVYVYSILYIVCIYLDGMPAIMIWHSRKAPPVAVAQRARASAAINSDNINIDYHFFSPGRFFSRLAGTYTRERIPSSVRPHTRCPMSASKCERCRITHARSRIIGPNRTRKHIAHTKIECINLTVIYLCFHVAFGACAYTRRCDVTGALAGTPDFAIDPS